VNQGLHDGCLTFYRYSKYMSHAYFTKCTSSIPCTEYHVDPEGYNW